MPSRETLKTTRCSFANLGFPERRTSCRTTGPVSRWVFKLVEHGLSVDLHPKNYGPLMSPSGQNRKGSQRAYVVRFCLKSRHRCCVPVRPLCATCCREQMQRTIL
jgi:hypothetical protein